MLLSNKKVLIFGGTGFLGKELVKKLVSGGFEDITIFSRDEGKLIKLVQEYKNINILTGDIYDKFEVYQAMKEKDYIFHLDRLVKHSRMFYSAKTRTYYNNQYRQSSSS